MKIKKGFILRQVGIEYMAVAIGAANDDLNGIIKINEAGAFLWNSMKEDITEAELVQKMLDRYEGLDRTTAETDLREFLDTIQVAVSQ